jgi:hypothetical protein
MTNDIEINQLETEKLNTANNFYLCHVYQAKIKEKNYIFKFYISFPEGFNTSKDNSEKEKNKIMETLKKENPEEKTYFFIYRYSDYIPINPEGL